MKKCKICGRETSNKKFCSRQCFLIYRQTHFRKKQSKLEKFLTKKIHQDFPDLIVESCNRQILGGIELDIWIPQLRVAIEINGKMHYEFIR